MMGIQTSVVACVFDVWRMAARTFGFFFLFFFLFAMRYHGMLCNTYVYRVWQHRGIQCTMDIEPETDNTICRHF